MFGDEPLPLPEQQPAPDDEFTVQLSRPIEGPDDEVEATVVPDSPAPPPSLDVQER